MGSVHDAKIHSNVWDYTRIFIDKKVLQFIFDDYEGQTNLHCKKKTVGHTARTLLIRI